jgi:serine/threonine protein kinase
VAHRDIKSDNVLLSGHTAVVTDFGIAKAIAAAAEAPAGATWTQMGTAIGTPAYMAPEQAAGDPPTDHRADISAFGCMAYEPLAGQLPFGSLASRKLIAAHMSETPQPVTQLRIDCPPALGALVMQCLAKDPEARPAGATELLQRLDAYLTAIQDYQDAIRQDSTFAIAHVELAFTLQTLGGPVRTADADTQLTTAFRLSDRLPERELYNAEDAYSHRSHSVAGESSRRSAEPSRSIPLTSTRSIRCRHAGAHA